ncbi:MAG: type VI secretion system protein TssA [Betaproteobacteria bacterium]|nr:type VI secretion system protein TssA [Betaproteobacteria bacterium]
MSTNLIETLETLLLAIPGNHPEGEDPIHSERFDAIREARRTDSPVLPQGKWVIQLKVADWDKIRQLCEEGLREHSKDLQLAVWYAEAMVCLEGFTGAALGMCLVEELLRRFRETLFPSDPEERVAKLEWLDIELGKALRQVPLTAQDHGGYDWYRWEESREMENLLLRGGTTGQNSYDIELKEGKIPAGDFEKSARETGADWYRARFGELAQTRAAHEDLIRAVEECFGDDAPGFLKIREALDVCQEVIERMFELCGGHKDLALLNEQPQEASHQTAPGSPVQSFGTATGSIGSRADAIRQLREIAGYFRKNEPHSPVALAAERAAEWAEMPLERWLKEVIDEGPVIKRLSEMLGFSPN